MVYYTTEIIPSTEIIPTQLTYSKINETSSYSITIIIVIIILCCSILLGIGAYFLLNKNSSIPTSSQPSTTITTNKDSSLSNNQESIRQLSTTQPPTTQPPTTTKSQMLYEFKEHKFTTADKTGPQGPTLKEVKKEYACVAWAQNSEFLNMTTQGIQEWKVPVTGTYKIQALGARGGGDGGGLGADITGTFSLSKNEVIKILVGQRGTLGKGNLETKNSGGGGGGSFVVKSDNNILIIAGGGGGGNSDFYDQVNYPNLESFPANTTQNGTSTYNNGGGINGNGGKRGLDPRDYTPASGGGGFNTSGEDGGKGSTGGKSFKSGGIGGLGVLDISICVGDGRVGDGGFGGGGGGWSNYINRGGGGGGYSGGQGGSYAYGSTDGRGGGGGSYINSENVNNLAVTNKDDGSVTITLISY